MSKKQTFGAALEYTMRTLGGIVNEVESVVSVSNTQPGSVVVEGNGDRVGLIIINFGTIDFVLSLAKADGTFKGIFLAANGGTVGFTVIDDYTLPTRRFYGMCPTGAGSSAYVLEYLRYARTEDK